MIDKTIWKEKANAFLFHLCISALVALTVAYLIYKIWYPYPYREILWGQDIYRLLIGIDVVIGPLITLIVFDKKKHFLEKASEIIFIAVLQITALGYGIWALAQARPAHIVFEYDHFQIVPIYLLPLTKPEEKFDHQIKLEPWTGPNLISLRSLQKDKENIKKWKKNIPFGGPPLAAQPSLWQPYELAKNEIISSSRPLYDLMNNYPEEKIAIEQAVKKTKMNFNSISYIPIYAGTNAGALLLPKNSIQIIGLVPLKSMSIPDKYGSPEKFLN